MLLFELLHTLRVRSRRPELLIVKSSVLGRYSRQQSVKIATVTVRLLQNACYVSGPR